MKKQLIYIGAGSNLGDRAENLKMACQLLPPAVNILRTSPVYQTEPWGYKEQDAFYNLVWEAETTLPPESLLSYLKDIEKRIGRVKNFRYGPRSIDLDILLYGELAYSSERLTIPHPQMSSRLFVLRPLSDLIPDGGHPSFNNIHWKELMKASPAMDVREMPGKIDFSDIVYRWGLRTYLMGIINLTPDSFSQDGILRPENDPVTAALQKAGDFIHAGADILDLGAESTRPGFQTIHPAEELQRLLPILQAIRKAYPSVTLSVDTRNASTAEEVLRAGADWINDVGGLVHDPRMAAVCAAADTKVIIMRSAPVDPAPDTIHAVNNELTRLIDHAQQAGVRDKNIIIDPGIGFGTTPEQNLEILQQLQEIKALGFPLLVGASRKSFLGHYLLKPVSDRLSGTIASTVTAIQNGADIVRVHDAAANYDAIKICDAIQRRQPDAKV